MKILSVKKGSQAEAKGLQSGDIVVDVNNSPARDYIDFMFYGSEERVHLTIQRESVEFSIDLTGYEDSGIEFEPMKITSCRNHCIFCFVDQNPAGMRKEIYVKDEDYRLSFLHGSYITLNNLTEYDCNRIVTQRLSPLYVSVHATEVKTRMKLLGRKHDDKMIETMDHLLSAGITMHCQIVVCPGINDDAVLEQTVYDLQTRYPSIISVAVIPVGLTKQREKLYPLKVMDEKDARTIIERIDRLHERFARENGGGFVFCSDEWYIRTGLEIPALDYYEDFPQIENGVGMLRNFLESVSHIENHISGGITRTGNFVFVTGTSMSPYIENFTRNISKIPGLHARTVTVTNRFYGNTITVSGLLTGRDIQSALEGIHPDETVVLPPNCLNESGVFLDDISPRDISDTLGVKVIRGEYNPLKLFFL